MPRLPFVSNTKKDRLWSTRLLSGLSLRPSQPTFVVNSVRNIHTVTAGDINADSSELQASYTGATSQLASAQQLALQQHAHQHSHSTSFTSYVAQGKQPVQRNYFMPHHGSNTTLVSQTSFPQSVGSPRYYTDALSEEDNLALRQGEYGHNVKNWTPKDTVLHHEARKELVPTVFMNKVAKVDAHAPIEEERQRSRQALEQQQVRSSNFPGDRLIKARGHDDYQASKPQVSHGQQASQSVYDLRSSNAPMVRQHPASTVSVVSPQPQRLHPKFSYEEINKPPSASSGITTRSSSYFQDDTTSSSAFAEEDSTQPSTPTPDLYHTRPVSNYFKYPTDNLPSHSVAPQRGALTRAEGYRIHMAKLEASRKASYGGTSYGAGNPSPSRRGGSPRGAGSPRAGSPLSTQVTQPHVFNPSVTFDNFTQQINSSNGKGKGYVPRGDPRAEPVRMSPARRLANKWSSPKLRGRSSPRKDKDDSIPDVPSITLL